MPTKCNYEKKIIKRWQSACLIYHSTSDILLTKNGEKCRRLGPASRGLVDLE